jgi:hypothetical protein
VVGLGYRSGCLLLLFQFLLLNLIDKLFADLFLAKEIVLTKLFEFLSGDFPGFPDAGRVLFDTYFSEFVECQALQSPNLIV